MDYERYHYLVSITSISPRNQNDRECIQTMNIEKQIKRKSEEEDENVSHGKINQIPSTSEHEQVILI